MEKSPLMTLDLRAPIIYAKNSEFFMEIAENREILLCYDLDLTQSREFEPDPERLLGSLAFSGEKTADFHDFQGETVELPAGIYLFMQSRDALSGSEWLELAVEQQKDGLWERHKPKNQLYVRFLYEDNSPVTQLFRPL